MFSNTLNAVSITLLLPAKVLSVGQISDSRSYTAKTVLVRGVVVTVFKTHRFTTGKRQI